VAYKIHLPAQLAAIYDVFHISQVKKCIKVPTEIIEQQAIEIEPDLSNVEQPLQILDTKERVTRRKKLKMYKILWDHHTSPGLHASPPRQPTASPPSRWLSPSTPRCSAARPSCHLPPQAAAAHRRCSSAGATCDTQVNSTVTP
jgi:hypothetical protein